MKKRLGLIILAVVISAAYFGYQSLQEVKITSLEQIVPDDAIYYVYSYSPDKKIKELKESALFKQIYGLSLYGKLKKLQPGKIKEKIPFISEILEKDTALAVYSLNDPSPSKKEAFNFGEFLFISRLDAKKFHKTKKAISDFYSSISGKGALSHEKYNGVKITSKDLPEMQLRINYAFFSDIFVLSNSEGIIKESIDLYRNKKQNSLLKNQGFQKITSKIKKDSLLWGYGDTKLYYEKTLHSFASDSLKSGARNGIDTVESIGKMKPFIDFMNVMEDHAFYIDYNDLKTGFILKSYQGFNQEMDKAGLIELLVSRKEIDKNTLRLVLDDVVAYYGANKDVGKTWNFFKVIMLSMEEVMKARMRNDPRYLAHQGQINQMSFQNVLKQAESFLGVDIEKDVVPLLGENFAAVFVGLDDVETAAVPPKAQSTSLAFPKFYVFYELKDSKKMETTAAGVFKRLVDNINQMVSEQKKMSAQKAAQNSQPQATVEQPAEEKPPLKLDTVDYKGANIYSIDIADFPLDFLKPNYCVLDKYLIISLSPELTKRVIDTYKDKKNSLATNFNFSSGEKESFSDYSNAIFFDFERLLNDINRSKAFNKLKDRLAQDKQKKFSVDDLDSLFKLLGNINTFVFTNRMVDAQTLESVYYLKIKGL